MLPKIEDLQRAAIELTLRTQLVAAAKIALDEAESHLNEERSYAYNNGLVTGSNDAQRKASEYACTRAQYEAVRLANRTYQEALANKAAAEINWRVWQSQLRLAELTASPIGGMIEAADAHDTELPF